VLGFALAGDFREGRCPALPAVSLYWHFVDVVWVFVLTVVYILPHLR
jgi:heme/copper-type cytochrome/quinol oxidase subunit 3